MGPLGPQEGMAVQFGAEGLHTTPRASDPESSESGQSCPDTGLGKEAQRDGKKQCWLGVPGWGPCLFSSGLLGWRTHQDGFIGILVLSLHSPSSIPISEAPAHGEFELVRTMPTPRAWVGWDQVGGTLGEKLAWDRRGTLPDRVPPTAASICSLWSPQPRRTPPPRKSKRCVGMAEREGCFLSQAYHLSHTALQSPLATMLKTGSENPEVLGNWQGTAGLPQCLSFLIKQIKQNWPVSTEASGKQKLWPFGLVLI